MENEGLKFLKASSYFDTEPEAYTEPMAPAQPIIKSITVPNHGVNSALSKLIAARRSKRLFNDKPISMEQLSYLLWATQGITFEKGNAKMRAVASAGNRHCFNTYVVPNRVAGLGKGLYQYDPNTNSLGQIIGQDISVELTKASFGQKMVGECAVTFVWTAVTARMTERYALRGYRYMLLDAGHVGAHLQLACEDLGLGSCNIAAYLDDEVSKVIGLKSEYEFPLYIGVAGWPV